MIGSNIGEVCNDCRGSVSAKDWTCPQCGSVLDKYLFSTVTAKTVSGADKEAFAAGQQACMDKWAQSRSTQLGEYRPTPGHETAYRAGWQHMAGKIEGGQDRKKGRKRGLQLLVTGTGLTLLGIAIMAGSKVITGGHVLVLPVVIVGSGVLSLVLGVVSIITGASDE